MSITRLTVVAATCALLWTATATADEHFVTRYGVHPVIHHTPQPLVQHGVRHTLTATTLFDSGSSTLRPVGTQVLDTLLDRVADFQPHYGMGHNGRVLGGQIVGHTDSVGRVDANQSLSERRAAAVARYLDSQGVNTRMLDTRGLGEHLPIASNQTPTGRAQNRRSELELEVVTLPGY